MNKVTAIIQARMASTRLPGKAMLDLAGKPILAHVIERTLAIKGVDTVVLATSIGDENIPLIELAEKMGIHTFVGSIDNVLERYYLAADELGGDFIIRVTGDNPFTDPRYASRSLKLALKSQADLCLTDGIPVGTAVEVIKRHALRMAYFSTTNNCYCEHVTSYILEHPEMFSIVKEHIFKGNPFGDLRLTIDTPEDYALAKAIYRLTLPGEGK